MQRMLGIDADGRELWVEHTDLCVCSMCGWWGQRSPIDLIPSADCPACDGVNTLKKEK